MLIFETCPTLMVLKTLLTRQFPLLKTDPCKSDCKSGDLHIKLQVN